jgi:hypothetical protein
VAARGWALVASPGAARTFVLERGKFGPRKQLHDEGDYRAEPMLDAGHRIALYAELAKLYDARRFQSAPMPGVRPGPPPTS